MEEDDMMLKEEEKRLDDADNIQSTEEKAIS